MILVPGICGLACLEAHTYSVPAVQPLPHRDFSTSHPRKVLGRCCDWLGLNIEGCKAIANVDDVGTDQLKELQSLNCRNGHVQQAEVQQPFNKLSLAECSRPIHIQILEKLFPCVSAKCLQDFGRQHINRHMPKPGPLSCHAHDAAEST